MRVGILQAGRAPEPLLRERSDYPDLLQALLGAAGASFAVYPVLDDTFPGSAEAADAWLITGSPHGANDGLPWIGRLETFVREIRATGRPLAGICFGHQLIAKALGGRVERHTDGWGVGPTTYRGEDGATVTLNAWHQDQVTEPPAGARTVLTAPGCRHAALSYDGRTFTVQAHPEFTDTFFRAFVALKAPSLPDAARESLARTGRSTDATIVARTIRRELDLLN